MTDAEANAVVFERVAEMKKNPAIQRKLTEKLMGGKSKEDCVQWLFNVAIATLCGNKAQTNKHFEEATA